MASITRHAFISDCGKYRYQLSRTWEPEKAVATFIMLNPSTADGTQDDPTIRKCLGFARQWGCRGLRVVNLFAFRATKPRDMLAADDPVGPDNHDSVLRAVDAAAHLHSGWGGPSGPVVCAWGTHGSFMDQDETVLGWLDTVTVRPQALGLTKDGHPKHPLYVPYSATLIRYAGRRSLSVGEPA